MHLIVLGVTMPQDADDAIIQDVALTMIVIRHLARARLFNNAVEVETATRLELLLRKLFVH